jgi:hypothetical protein
MKQLFRNITLVAVALMLTTTPSDDCFAELKTNHNAAIEMNQNFQYS